MGKRYSSLADYFERTGRPRADAAKAWGVTEATISRWVTGSRQPQGEHLLLVAEDTGLDVVTLLRASTERVA